jgi:hypothetical protein
MLTKWGSALGLASAGRIVSLSGSPLGVSTIWGEVGNWSLLSTIPAGDIRNNDEVPINTLGTSHSNGIAQRHNTEWRLIEGKWNTVADMVAWNTTPGQVVHAGAFARVKATGGNNSDAVTYIYQGGNWVRFAGLTTGYAWAISSLFDFSAIGLRDGDFGIFTPSGGSPITVRYKAACDIAPGAGDGTTPMWLPPVVYAGTPEIKSYLIGNEATDGAITAKNWTIARVAPGTLGTVAGYMQLFGPSGGGSATLQTAAITGATKFYLVGDFRGSATGNAFVGIFGNVSVSVPAQYALARGVSSGFIRQLSFTNPSYVIADTLSQIQGSGLNWPASVPYLVQALSGAVISDLIESRIDGKLYSSYRRNFNGAVDASSYALQLFANGGGGGVTSTLEVRNVYLVTY